jgi:hypothetical protein
MGNPHFAVGKGALAAGARRRPGLLLTAAAAALLLGWLATRGHSQAAPGPGGRAELVGTWLGPFPGPNGPCNPTQHPESTEMSFQAAGSFAVTFNADPSTFCAGGTLYGTYQIQGNVIRFREQGEPGCFSCAQTSQWSVGFSFPASDALQLCDTTAGQCWTYYRQ